MAAPRVKQTKPRTKLVVRRMQAGRTPREVWEATGLCASTYLRL